MNNPLISIILPVCDSEDYLEDCVKSIKRQSYKNIEVIAVDDASRDNSLKILRQIKTKNKRFKLKIYKNKNRYGLRITLNRALTKIKGQYIAFMDPASINYVHRISSQIDFLIKNPKIGAVGTQCKFIDNSGRIFEKSSFPVDTDELQKNLISVASLQPETFMINKSVLPKDILRFESEAYPYLYTNLLMKLSQYAKVSNLARNLVYFRKIQNEHAFEDKMEKLFEHIRIWIKTATTYQQKPSIKSFLTPLIKEI